MNATDAAIEAGYSKKTARAIGYENLTKPHINEYIQKKEYKLAILLDKIMTFLVRRNIKPYN